MNLFFNFYFMNKSNKPSNLKNFQQMKKGETMKSIAKNYDASTRDLLRLNPDIGRKPKANTVIIVPNKKSLRQKSVLEILVEEVLNVGIDKIGCVISPGDENSYKDVVGDYARYIKFIGQKEALGYGHAIYTASEFVGNFFNSTRSASIRSARIYLNQF